MHLIITLGRFILTACFILFSFNTSANEPRILENDPNRPVDKISADLEITESQFVECFNNVHPSPKGNAPTEARELENKRVLLPCLQKANPNITNNKLDIVMGKYRPKDSGVSERQ